MPDANFIFIRGEEDLSSFSNFRMARIDGRQALTLRHFYEQLAEDLDFPDDFDQTLESLDEHLNDLSWIDEDQIGILITHTDAFLADEKSDAKKLALFNVLDATAEDWKWPDEEEADPKEFIILLEDNEFLRRLLDEEGFHYEWTE